MVSSLVYFLSHYGYYLLKLSALAVVFMKVLCGQATFGKGASSHFCCVDKKLTVADRRSLRCRQCRVSHKLIFRSTGGERYSFNFMGDYNTQT